MPNLYAKLPNLNALIAFEAAGRLNSFTRAADELGLTQGAVSHQIKQLEETLGIKLFRREHKRITLTQDGSHYLNVASQAILQIIEATDELRSRASATRFVIATSDAVCLHWLMPRLSALRDLEPSIDLQVVSFQDNSSGTSLDVDLGIQYGGAAWPGYRAEFLAAGQLVPVCSPRYFADRGKPADPGRLKQEMLLELEYKRHPQYGWRHWFRHLGVKGPYPQPRLRLGNYLILNKATFEGQGIALGWRYLIEDHLANNWFEIAYPAAVDTKENFQLVVPTYKTLNRQQRTIRDWIMESFRATPNPL